jgi:hypothetical protein
MGDAYPRRAGISLSNQSSRVLLHERLQGICQAMTARRGGRSDRVFLDRVDGATTSGGETNPRRGLLSGTGTSGRMILSQRQSELPCPVLVSPRPGSCGRTTRRAQAETGGTSPPRETNPRRGLITPVIEPRTGLVPHSDPGLVRQIPDGETGNHCDRSLYFALF